MRRADQRSREIIEILADVVKSASDNCTLTVMDESGEPREIPCPDINYVFGNAQYVKERLDELSRTPIGNEMKFPLIALFCPFTEQRNTVDYYTKGKVRMLIAYSSMQQWSNEQRLQTSFQNILRPIYRAFLEALHDDGRFDFGYGVPQHEYSENYSYGRYGALTATGEQVSEPIDAINISNLELKVKHKNCR